MRSVHKGVGRRGSRIGLVMGLRGGRVKGYRDMMRGMCNRGSLWRGMCSRGSLWRGMWMGRIRRCINMKMGLMRSRWEIMLM